MYKGQIKGFPKEVIEKMLDYQVAQGNNLDVSVFEKDNTCSRDEAGFDWAQTIEGSALWCEVIMSKKFDLFFEKYPKETSKEETPTRYKANASYDVIDICKAYNLNFNLGNIVKYAVRQKGQDIEDLEKIISYAKRELKHLKNESK